MKKTHKQMLGFVGLGLVAVTTVAAAMLPSPTASAVTTGVTDTIQVTVVTGNPDLSATTESASEITSPEYAFSVTYNRLTKLKITLKNYDDDGDIKFSADLFDEAVQPMPGTKDFNLNLDDYGGKGNFVIIVSGTGDDGVELEQVLSVSYTTESEESDVDPDSGEADVDADIPYEDVAKVVIEVKDEDGNVVKTIEITDPQDIENIDLSDLPNGDYDLDINYYDKDGNLIGAGSKTVTKTDSESSFDVEIKTKIDTVTTIEANIYDADGNIVRTIEYNREDDTTSVYDKNGNLLFVMAGGYKDGKLTISMEGLPYGDYTGLIMFRNKYGRLVGDTVRFTIKYYGKPIVVPDTGSFFQGLNISREDYLITGAIVFMTIGVVAFGVVKRGHATRNSTRINGKRR